MRCFGCLLSILSFVVFVLIVYAFMPVLLHVWSGVAHWLTTAPHP